MNKIIFITVPLVVILLFAYFYRQNNQTKPKLETLPVSETTLKEEVETEKKTELDKNFLCSDGNGVINGILTDNRNNQTYKTAMIGSQCWMAENLNFDDGCSKIIWVNDTNQGWCGCYNDNPENCETYGLLYQWGAAMKGSAVEKGQGICPDGWHIPSDEEWKTLEIFLGMTEEDADTEGSERSSGNVKSKLTKETNKDYSGFAALPGGFRVGDGRFNNLKTAAYFTSSTAAKVDNAWRRNLDWLVDGVGRRLASQSHAYSVRCLRD